MHMLLESYFQRVPLPPADIADESPRLLCLDEVRIQSSKVVPSRDAKGKKIAREPRAYVQGDRGCRSSISVGIYLIEVYDGKIGENGTQARASSVRLQED